MAERDPFGRLPDENPLAGLGTLSDGIDSQAPAQPVVSARPSAAKPGKRPRDEPRGPDERPRYAPPDPRLRVDPRAPGPAEPAGSPQAAALRDLLVTMQKTKEYVGIRPAVVAGSVGRIVKVAVVVAIIVAVVGGLGGLVSVGERVKDSVSDLPAKLTPPSGTFGGGAEPVGLAKNSLLLRRNLAPALRRMRTSGLGRLKSLSIRPQRLDAQLLTKDGRLRSVQQRFDGKLGEVSISGGGFGALKTIAFSRANSAAPSRLARSAARRMRRPVSHVDYVVLVDSGPQAVWTVVMQGGGQFLGDARGRITRRIG
jgi:hypothetical protein